jgi:hypothetical protein
MYTNDYYVYVYLNPLTPGEYIYDNLNFAYEPFYVGRGINYRYKVHIQPYKLKHKSAKNALILELKNNNIEPIIKLCLTGLTYMESLNKEKEYIFKIGRIKEQGPLLNITSGGQGLNGYTHSPKSIKKMLKTMKERGVYEKLSENMKGENNIMFGDKWHRTENGKKSFREKMLGVSTLSSKKDEEKETIYKKISNTLKGRKVDKETLEKRKLTRGKRTKAKIVKIININTLEENEFNSMTSAAKFLFTCKGTLQYRYKKGIIFNNIKILSIE